MKYKSILIVCFFIIIFILVSMPSISSCKDIVACGSSTQGPYNLLLKVRDPSRPGYQVLTMVPENYSYNYHHPWTGETIPFTVNQSYIGVATVGDTIPEIVKAGMCFNHAGLAFGDADTITNWKNPSKYAWDDFDWIRYACQTANNEKEAVSLLTEHAVDKLHASAVPENLFVLGPKKGYVIEADMVHYHIKEITDDVVVMSNYCKNLWNKSLFLRLISPSFSSTYQGEVHEGQIIKLGPHCFYGIKIVSIKTDAVIVRQIPFQWKKSNIYGSEFERFSPTIHIGQQETVGFYHVLLDDVIGDTAQISMSFEYYAWEKSMKEIMGDSFGNITVSTMMQWSRLHEKDLNGLRGMCDNETLYPFEGAMIYKIPEKDYELVSQGWFSANHPCSSIYVPVHISNTDIYDPYESGEAAKLSHMLLNLYGHDLLSIPFCEVEQVFIKELNQLEPMIKTYIEEGKDVSSLLTISDIGMQKQAFLTQQYYRNLSKIIGSKGGNQNVFLLWKNNSETTLKRIGSLMQNSILCSLFPEINNDLFVIASSIVERKINLVELCIGNNSLELKEKMLKAKALMVHDNMKNAFCIFYSLIEKSNEILQRYDSVLIHNEQNPIMVAV